MIEDIMCPSPALNRLGMSGVLEKAYEKARAIEDVFIHDSIYSERGVKILKWAEKTFFRQNRRINDQSESARDILELEFGINELHSFRLSDDTLNLLMEHPSFLARLVLGRKVFDFRRMGFPTRRSLEESIASFCIGERSTFNPASTEHVWWTGNFRNCISLNMHGDLYACQVDVSGREEGAQTLFGREVVFDTMKKNVEVGAIHGHQDWSTFLISTLRYAEAIGKRDLDEIVNWRDILEKTGAAGTATAEAMFGGSGWDFSGSFFMSLPILREDMEKLEAYPICVVSRQNHYIPLVEDRKLIYLRKSSEGEITLNSRFGGMEGAYSPCIEWCEYDLPEILRATYCFFARDRALLPKIMDSFLQEQTELTQVI